MVPGHNGETEAESARVMTEDRDRNVRLYWLNGTVSERVMDVTINGLNVPKRDGTWAHFRETDTDPDGTPAYKEVSTSEDSRSHEWVIDSY